MCLIGNNAIDSMEVWDGNRRVTISGPFLEWRTRLRCAHGGIQVYLYNSGIINYDVEVSSHDRKKNNKSMDDEGLNNSYVQSTVGSLMGIYKDAIELFD